MKHFFWNNVDIITDIITKHSILQCRDRHFIPPPFPHPQLFLRFISTRYIIKFQYVPILTI